MLSAIKHKTKGWIAYAIIIIITIPFALFGIHQYFYADRNVAVATVAGKEISRLEYLNLLQKMVRDAQEQLGENYSNTIEQQLKQQAINTLVNKALLTQIAEELGLATAPDEIKLDILTNKAFFKDGQFDLDTYTQVLQLNDYTPAQYEAELLRAKTNVQLRENLVKTAFITDSEKALIANLLDEQRNISYSEFAFANFADKVKITDAQIGEYYETNKASLQNPAQIKLKMITLDSAELAKKFTPTEEEITQTYEAEKTRWQTEEERDASHILVKDKALADTLLTQIKGGADFATLAAENSIDSTNAKEGGKLGFFTKGVMVPEFEQAVFAMKVGDVSEVVKTDFGYHIIKLNAIKKATTKPLSAVRDEVIALYQKEQAQSEFFTLDEQLRNTVYEQGLDAAAEDLGLTVQHSDFVTRNSKDFDAKVLQAAFSAAVTQNNEAVVVTLAGNKSIALAKEEYQPSTQQTLEEARTHIRTILTTEQSKVLARKQAEQLIANKGTLQHTVGWVYRNHQDRALAPVVNFAFRMGKDTPYDSAELADKIIVVNVKGKRIQPQKNAPDLDILATDYADEMFNDILEVTRKNSDVKIFNNLL